ncbi:hypothetical protein NA57DRAFT_82367 [Rhizodiscina lignyota]|uniref:Acyltransferase 3 domain-containing protein n=1 Tax=Rhizodiscina lignyota TaxID=1504668 RepID=A0A9P4I463_9PEZI|nr:hypothetical protein NA57DRAFT_82367 [Rhizodiscina lignyota]
MKSAPRSPRSPLSPSRTWSGLERASDTAWAEGLRGIAAVGVVSSHLVLSFALDLVPPCDDGPDGDSRFFQVPLFRLIVQGEAFVALFFILTGFVNSLKPLKQSQSSDIEGALVSLARSSLNRIPRLILPAATVTIITWFACQLGFFELARQSGAYWMRVNSRQPSISWSKAAQDLVVALTNTWIWGENPYDQPQWAMTYLLKGSMYIFILLLITATTRPGFRFVVFGLAYGWSWLSGDGLVGLNVFAGMFLAELHTTQMLPEIRSKALRALPFFTALLGLYLMSFPADFAGWKPWTRQLKDIGNVIFPTGVHMGRFWTGIGAQILTASIQISPEMRRGLSTRVCTFLGSISFSIYLLHGPLMRSVLAWMTFGPSWLINAELVDDAGFIPPPAGNTLLFILPIFASFLVLVASLWTVKVEPYFGRATKFLQSLADAEGPILVK